MKQFSNKYIFLYISLLVVFIAAILSIVSLQLKPRQEENREQEKMQQILKAAGYGEVEKSMATVLFHEVAEPLSNSANREMYQIRCSDGMQGTVVYVNGKGLWGAIWGYVVLAEDHNTIKGAVFSHKSETPGLGANITEDKFAASFIGKKIRDKDGKFVSIKVLQKSKAGGGVADENRADAISGATITSRGVEQMLFQCLKEIEE